MDRQLAAAVPPDRIKTVDDLHQKWRQVLAGDCQAILLDVRSLGEFQAGHIQGSRHLEAGSVDLLARELGEPSAEIWVFCRTDQRARHVASGLHRLGFGNAYLVARSPEGIAGGLTGWLQRGHPVVD